MNFIDGSEQESEGGKISAARKFSRKTLTKDSTSSPGPSD